MSITTDAVAHSRFALSQDVVQASYRLLAVALLCAALTALSDVFFTTNNILNVLRQTALLFLMASGLTLVILTAGLDLSVGANIALSACLAASVMKSTGSPFSEWQPARLWCHGRVCQRHSGDGAENSIVYRHLWHDVDAHRHHLLLYGRRNHSRLPAGFRQLGSGYLLGVPMPVYVMILFLLIGAFRAAHRLGQQIYAIGANPVSARLSGVPVERRLVLVYAVSGAMAGWPR